MLIRCLQWERRGVNFQLGRDRSVSTCDWTGSQKRLVCALCPVRHMQKC